MTECGEYWGGVPKGRADPALVQAGRLGEHGVRHGPALFEEEDDELVGGGQSSAAGPGATVGTFSGKEDRWMLGTPGAVAGGEVLEGGGFQAGEAGMPQPDGEFVAGRETAELGRPGGHWRSQGFGSQCVVPGPVPFVRTEGEAVHDLVGDGDAGGVGTGVEFGADGQSGAGTGDADGADHDLMAGQGPAAPVDADLGIQPVFYLVPL